MKIEKLFKSDQHGNALPELTPGMEWVLNNPKTMISIMLRGVALQVTFPDEKTGWTLAALPTNTNSTYAITDGFPQDKAILEAFKRQTTKSTGTFIAYGKNVWGNPHNLTDTFLMRLTPIDGNLIVGKNKTKVKLVQHVTVKDFYDSVKEELAESPEIYGLVFFVEDTSQKQVLLAKVRQKDMGLQWPRQIVQSTLPLKVEYAEMGMGWD